MRIHFVLLILISTISYAQDIDLYFGKYYDSNDSGNLSFTFTNRGIEKLIVKNETVPDSIIKYDLLGIHGESLLLKFYYLTNTNNVTEMLIYFNGSEYIISSGHYTALKYRDEASNMYNVVDKFSFELKYTRLPDEEIYFE